MQLARKQASLAEIEESYSDAKDAAKEAELAQSHQQRQTELHDELAWAKVGEVEDVSGISQLKNSRSSDLFRYLSFSARPN